MKPNTGNPGCDQWIVDTFRRETRSSALMGCEVQELRIKAIPADTVLSEDQFRGLIRYLQTTLCGGCNGTGFDPDTLDGKCQYCADMPF